MVSSPTPSAAALDADRSSNRWMGKRTSTLWRRRFPELQCNCFQLALDSSTLGRIVGSVMPRWLPAGATRPADAHSLHRRAQVGNRPPAPKAPGQSSSSSPSSSLRRATKRERERTQVHPGAVVLDNTAHQLQSMAGWEPPAGLLGLHGGHHRITMERALGRSCLLLGAGMAPVPAQDIES